MWTHKEKEKEKKKWVKKKKFFIKKLAKRKNREAQSFVADG